VDIALSIPDRVARELSRYPKHLPTHEDRMRMIIHFSKLFFEHGTGGPFAAGVFEQNTGKLIPAGVNIVIPSNCSSAHAEIMTLSIAQKKGDERNEIKNGNDVYHDCSFISNFRILFHNEYCFCY